MKIVYDEALLQAVIREQIFPKAEEATDFPLEHLVTAFLRKANGERSFINCILEVKEDGILVVLMDAFHADRAKAYRFLEFSNMQGIKVRRGTLNVYVTLQFKDGTNYHFQIMKRSSKRLPHQTKNLEYSVGLLEKQNLHDMKHKPYRNLKIKKKVSSFIYVTTLALFVIIAAYLWEDLTAADSFFSLMLFFIGAMVVHFVFMLIFGVLIDTLKDRRFKKEYRMIIQEYQRTANARILLNELENIQRKPKTDSGKHSYYFSLSTALHKNNRNDEALAYLNRIYSTDRKVKEAVQKQRDYIEKERKEA